MKKSKERIARAGRRRRVKVLRRLGIAVALTFLLAIGGWYFLRASADHEQPVYLTEVAPTLTLETIAGDKFVSSEHLGEHNLLLYFSEGIGCGACWDQVVDLEADWGRFEGLNVELVSIMVDSLPELKAEAQARGITGILASDPDKSASQKYGALEASMHPGVKPGHTFVLVNKYGRIIWRWDWIGHGKPMYLEVDELYNSVSQWLEQAGNKALCECDQQEVVRRAPSREIARRIFDANSAQLQVDVPRWASNDRRVSDFGRLLGLAEE